MGAIKEKVNQLIKKYNTNDPFKIVEGLGIAVVYEQLGSILGYYSKSHRLKVIHINKDSNEKKQLFTCCHELGHAVLHPDVNTPFLKSNTYYSTDKIEQEANDFAIELLFLNNSKGSVTIQEIEEYGIPKQLIYKKINKINKVTII